ncbi:hypothetical protein C8R45DRAFT_965875 [Mycena sanguinolenta]|nr:hypothetical protein C8R45DRAFT_965875 [Mycena sanguinolenta]
MIAQRNGSNQKTFVAFPCTAPPWVPFRWVFQAWVAGRDRDATSGIALLPCARASAPCISTVLEFDLGSSSAFSSFNLARRRCCLTRARSRSCCCLLSAFSFCAASTFSRRSVPASFTFAQYASTSPGLAFCQPKEPSVTCLGFLTTVFVDVEGVATAGGKCRGMMEVSWTLVAAHYRYWWPLLWPSVFCLVFLLLNRQLQ